MGEGAQRFQTISCQAVIIQLQHDELKYLQIRQIEKVFFCSTQISSIPTIISTFALREGYLYLNFLITIYVE